MTGPTSDRSSNTGPRGLSAGPILLAIGAAALLVSLFLNWFKPELTAWTAFEIVDLLLALIALTALYSVFARAVPSAGAPALPAGADAGLAGIALLLVVVALLNHPPAAFERELDTGAWIGFAGAFAMAAGAALERGRVSVTLSFSPRDRAATPASPPSRPESPPAAAGEPTERLGYEDRPGADPETRELRPDDRA